jgi:hypothetical protein
MNLLSKDRIRPSSSISFRNLKTSSPTFFFVPFYLFPIAQFRDWKATGSITPSINFLHLRRVENVVEHDFLGLFDL